MCISPVSRYRPPHVSMRRVTPASRDGTVNDPTLIGPSETATEVAAVEVTDTGDGPANITHYEVGALERVRLGSPS